MEGMVSASIGAVLPKLANMLADEYNLHKGAKEGICYIRDELESMQAALEKVSDLPVDELDKQIKLWARDLREMSYRIEDTLESYIVHIDDTGESSKTCCTSIKGMLPQKYKTHRNIATEIEHIKKKVEEVSKRRERYKVDGIVPRALSDLRLAALYEDQAKLVGIDHLSEEIIKLLSMDGESASKQDGESASEKKLKLVSIVGGGGMGKTTLANVVYEKLKEKFDCSAFVSVSLKPNIKSILSSILRQVTDIKDVQETKDKSLQRRESQKSYGNVETWSEKEVIDKIRLVLKKRRYLIVIDDIWDKQAWKHIKCVLFESKLGSKVITTTRNADVAKLCCSYDEIDGIIYEMQPLSDGDSKKLLYYKVFGTNGCPVELNRVAHDILERCKGWPLAIITIASLLANKPTQTKDQWQSVYKSISTGLGNSEEMKDMRLILSLSYRDMPSQLRACLLYLSIFPEDRIIGKDDLIRRWVAEGFVHGRDEDLYELGEKYFNDLINRSMIQPAHVDSLGRAQACRVHDLILEFITSLSAEENLITILNGQPFPPQSDNIYRLSLRYSKEEHGIPRSIKRLPHVRTLVVSSRAIDSMPSLTIFPVLRVLDLEQCTNRSISAVGNLVHLRYLRLSREYFRYGVCIKLPKEIGNLQFLQTLDLKEARIAGLASSMVQLGQLRVLEISFHGWDKRYESCLLQCLCNLKKLETIYIYAADLSLGCMLQIDWTPSHLRRFTACIRRQTEHILKPGSVWAELSPFSTLPRWINSSLSSLSELSIMVRKLVQRDIEILADLSILFTMELEVVEATEGKLVISGHATAFRCLGNLKFASRAVGLVFRPGAMQKLHKLYLCFDLAETKDVHGDFDLGLENLTSLKSVDVDIDCRCARLWEVEAAEAALRNATNANENHPVLDVRRHFERVIVCDNDEIPEELGAKNKEEAQLSRIGPWGGNGGRARDIRVSPYRLETVTIHSNSVIGSIEFSYSDHNGKQHSIGPWGCGDGRASTIQLDPSEYLTEVSGTIGKFHAVSNVITSLTFVTNTTSHGPFGGGGGDSFVYRVQSNSSIVGFFGRAGWWVDAIGLYVRPL